MEDWMALTGFAAPVLSSLELDMGVWRILRDRGL
jgi:hypothetical protein